MFKNGVRDVGWSVGLGAEYGALAGLAYAASFGFVAALLALGDGLGGALALAGYVTLWAGLVALVVGAALGTVCGLLVGLAAPAVPVGLGGRAATVLLVVLALAVAAVAATSGTDPWVVVLGAMVVVAWPALFAVPALLLHARAVTRRVHPRSS
ncbi:hypothetical protein [Angustibacter speluncae]